VDYNFEIGINETKLLTEYENVTHKVLLGNTVLAKLMSVRKYDVIIQNRGCSRESHGNAENNLELLCRRIGCNEECCLRCVVRRESELSEEHTLIFRAEV
jgi:hypothetical protein